MIETKFATEQLERLSGLSFFPKPAKGDTASQAAFRELRLALECAATDSIGKLVVDDWLRSNAEAPKPAQLRQATYDENDRLDREQARKFKPPEPRSAHCPDCQDFGIVESTDANDLNSIASWCDCTVGQERFRTAHGPTRRCNPKYSVCPACVNESRKRLLRVIPRSGLVLGDRRISTRESKFKSVAEIYNGEY